MEGVSQQRVVQRRVVGVRVTLVVGGECVLAGPACVYVYVYRDICVFVRAGSACWQDLHVCMCMFTEMYVHMCIHVCV